MIIIQSKILTQFGNLVNGVSTKTGWDSNPPDFNQSLTVGDNPANVWNNRKDFFSSLGIELNSVAFQNQIHSDIVSVVNEPGSVGKSDAMITDRTGIALAISLADCTPILIYDDHKKIIAGVHSGWRGTAKKILPKTLGIMFNKFNCSPGNLFCYVGPSISKINYEVGEEVVKNFDSKYYSQKNEKYLLDVPRINYDYLIEAGIPKSQINLSNLCTFQQSDLLHSYRKDGNNSGRMFAAIMMKNNE